MIRWRFGTQDVANVRFAYSPVWEAVLSLIVLRAPGRHALHVPWVRAARTRVAAIDLSELFALVPVRGITADFLSPPPSTPLPDVAEELQTVLATPAERVLADLIDVPDMPAAARRRIEADPAAAVQRIVDTLERYWDCALAADWPRIRALMEADILWRARRLADGGLAELFADLHPSVRWDGAVLNVEDPWQHESSLSGEGLVLVPTVMGWPTVRKMVAPYQPTVAYPARAVATVWERGASTGPAPLGRLLGRTRACLLQLLSQPMSTTVLAVRTGVTAGAVSQHLAVLRDNGLVTSSRVDGSVLYRRSRRGDVLVEAEGDPVE